MKELILALTIGLGLGACGGSKPSQQQSTPPGSSACIKSGCSGTVCAEPGKEVITNCLYKPEYGCYTYARCERQANGACGWTQTAELTACLANPPPM